MITKKMNYTAPAVIDDLALELEAEILGASADLQVDESIDKVETMGQEIGGTIGTDQWTQSWE
jgi:hypothetical protein